ncbi:uncharacterized protein LOC144122145 isoform X1 [Amblyomma americanum]
MREQTWVNDILVEIKRKKWAWAGHVMQRQDNRWSLRVTEWIPREGKRSRGRQEVRWAGEIKEFAGMRWPQLAKDRVNWRHGRCLHPSVGVVRLMMTMMTFLQNKFFLQAPMDVAESQETLAGPSQQAPMDVTESQETLPGPSQQASMDVATMLDIQPGPSQAFQLTPELPTLPTAPASVGTPRRRRPAMVNGPVKCAYF